MTVLGGCTPSDPFKGNYGSQFGMGSFVPTSTPTKPRRQETIDKPIEQYRYWVALIYNEGDYHMRSSPAFQSCKQDILQPAKKKCKELVDQRIIRFDGDHATPQKQQSSELFRSMDAGAESFTSSTSKKLKKRRLQGSFQAENTAKKHDVRHPIRGQSQVTMRLDDMAGLEKWFSDAFKAVQQVGCRTIAKCWIKKIHPKKQSTHPYNGNLPRDLVPSPNRTRPPYWPQSVIHKEPDHIDRNARTALLVHLISQTPIKQLRSPGEPDIFLYATDLLQALEEKKNDFKDGRWQIVEEIVRVRGDIEEYHVGNLNGSNLVYMTDHSEAMRSSKADPDGSVDDEMLGGDSEATNSEDAASNVGDNENASRNSFKTEEDGGSSSSPQSPMQAPAIRSDQVMDANNLGPTDHPIDHIAHLPQQHFLQHKFTFDPHDQSPRSAKIDHQVRLRHHQPDPLAYQPDEKMDPYFQPWPSHTMEESPNTFIPTDFPYNGISHHSSIPHNSFHPGRVNMHQTVRPTDESVNMFDSGTYRPYIEMSNRPLPMRAMSTPHTLLMEQEARDMGMLPTYFSG